MAEQYVGKKSNSGPSQPLKAAPLTEKPTGISNPTVTQVHAGQLHELQKKVSEFAVGVESAAANIYGHDRRNKQASTTRKFAVAVDKEVAALSTVVDQAEAECMSARMLHSAANHAAEEVFHAAESLGQFLEDVKSM